MVLAGGDAGLRLGEIIALEWRDIDLAVRRLTVERSDGQGHVTVPKGGRSRRLPMTQRLTAALKTGRHLRGDRVLCLPDGSPITRDRVIKAVRGAQRVAGIEQGVHILRQPACSAFAPRATADKSRSTTPASRNERAEASEHVRGSRDEVANNDANERKRVSHRSGAGIEGAPASDCVRGLGTKSPDQDWIAGYGDRTRLTGLGSQDITTMLSPPATTDRSTGQGSRLRAQGSGKSSQILVVRLWLKRLLPEP